MTRTLTRRARPAPLLSPLLGPWLTLLLTLLLWTTGPAPALAEPATGRWPLRPEPTVVTGFDPPASPWGAGHRGVDLSGTVGQTVLAARAGTVRFAGRLAGRGVVVVDHGSTRTTYEPVRASVAVGDRVGPGDRIGTLALFGSHCFPQACLHWGLIEGDTYLDPLTLVGAGPVRLLPWSGALSSGTSPDLSDAAVFRADPHARGWAWR